MYRCTSLAAALTALLASVPCAQAQETRTFLYDRLVCTDGHPLPSVTQTSELYFLEFKRHDERTHRVCALVTGFSILSQLPLENRVPPPIKQECESFDMVSYTVMCRGGAVSAARFFFAASTSRTLQDGRGPFDISGESLLAPIHGSYTRPPEAFVPLPAGYGFDTAGTSSPHAVTFPWQQIVSGSGISVSGSIPTTEPTATPAPKWVRALSTWWPRPQLAIGVPLLAFGIIALVGINLRDEEREGSPGQARTGSLLVLFAVAITGLLSSATPASMPDAAVQRVRAAISAAQAQLAQVERDRTTLRDIIRISPTTGMLEPFSASDFQRVQNFMGVRSIGINTSTETNTSFWASASLLPSLVFALAYLPAFVRGRHYLFVRHPAAVVAAPSLRSGALLDKQKLGQALRPNPAELHKHPPAYKSWNLFERARALREKIHADADIADAAMRRDRARAQKIEAEAELRAARKKLPWWQRWVIR
jgi:hypothetical protein